MGARGAAPGQKRGMNVTEVQAARKRYEQAIEEGGRVSQRAVSSGFEDGRHKSFAEFERFLESIGCPGVGAASGVDVVAFLQGWWLPSHQKNCRTRVSGQGEAVASASAIKGVINHIAKSYSIMGFCDERNPGKSESVRSYREGYRVTLRELGVREKRAKVMPEEKVMGLIEYLNNEVRKLRGVERCVAAMDSAVVLYLWESWARGKECGSVTEKHQIDFAGRVVRPGWSKTVREEPSAEISMKDARTENTFLWAAGLLMHEMDACGEGKNSEFLFRPLNKRRNGFEDTGLTAEAMSRRVQKHLLKAGLYEGETLHSFRRSAVQHAAARARGLQRGTADGIRSLEKSGCLQVVRRRDR